MAKQQSLRNDGPKQIADAWKLISKLAKDFANSLHAVCTNPADDRQTVDESLNWLEFCVKSICELIQTSVERLFDHSDDIKKKVAFKLNTFYAMILHNLSELYSKKLFRGQTFFIEFIVTMSSVL